MLDNDTLQQILNKYDTEKTLSSYIIPNSTIRQLKTLTLSNNPVDGDVVLNILLRHQWNHEKETATDACVARILSKIFNLNFDIEQNFSFALMRSLQMMGHFSLLNSSEHAQANFTAITQGGGKYARGIADALRRFQEAYLLSGEHAQKNVALLFRYVSLSGNNCGINFAVECMKDLTQERFSLLMLDESVSIGKEQFAFFSDIFSFVVPDENMGYEDLNYWLLVEPMMRLHEYIHTYFIGEKKSEVLSYFKNMLDSNPLLIDCSRELFSLLCQHFYHQGNHSSIWFDENNLMKPLMLAILEMLAKSRNPDASFPREVCERINEQLRRPKTLSTSNIGSPSAEETKTEESEHQVKESLEEEFPVNERIVTLLLFSIRQSPETFQTACDILKNFSVPSQLTRFSVAFSNVSLFQKSNSEVSEPLLNDILPIIPSNQP